MQLCKAVVTYTGTLRLPEMLVVHALQQFTYDVLRQNATMIVTIRESSLTTTGYAKRYFTAHSIVQAPGAEPLVKDNRAKPPEAERF